MTTTKNSTSSPQTGPQRDQLSSIQCNYTTAHRIPDRSPYWLDWSTLNCIPVRIAHTLMSWIFHVVWYIYRISCKQKQQRRRVKVFVHVLLWNSIEAAPPILHCTRSQRGPEQTITLPTKWAGRLTCCVAVCVQTALYSPQRHLSPTLGTVGELREHHLLRWESPLLKQSPSRLLFCCHMAHLCLCTQPKQRHRAVTKRLRLFPEVFSLCKFCRFSVPPHLISYEHNT